MRQPKIAQASEVINLIVNKKVGYCIEKSNKKTVDIRVMFSDKHLGVRISKEDLERIV